VVPELEDLLAAVLELALAETLELVPAPVQEALAQLEAALLDLSEAVPTVALVPVLELVVTTTELPQWNHHA
jgi:hypothetical protein